MDVKTILSLSKSGDNDGILRVLNEVDEIKLKKVITSQCNGGYDDLGPLMKAIFQGSPCRLENGRRRRSFVFFHCIHLLNQESVSSKASAEIIGTLLLEFDETSSDVLCELAEKICQSVRNDGQCNGRVFQIFPKILSTISSREVVPLNTENDGELTGEQYRNQVMNTLCSSKWNPSCVIHLANMFREMVLSKEELKFAIEKILRMFKHLELEEIPPVVYQLLILSYKGHRVSVLEGITSYFNELDVKCGENEQEPSDLNNMSRDQLRQTEGNVILHVTFAIKQDHELGKEFVKLLKAYQQHPHKILTSFNLALALSVARIHRLETPIFDILKAAVFKSYKDVQMRRSSKWTHESTDDIPDVSKEILQTVQNSMFGWDQVAQGVIQLGFILMDAFMSKSSENNNCLSNTPQQETSNLGSSILLTTFQGRDIFRDEIVEQILNRLLTKTTSSAKSYLDLLKKAVLKNPQALLDCLPKVKEAFEYLSYLPCTTAEGLLLAVLPLIKISVTLRSSLMLVLRKALLSRNIEPRKIAVTGFLMILKHFKVSGSSIGSSQPLSQSSQSTSHSLNHIQVDVHRSAVYSGNEALCLEILGGLRRCFTQQPDIRVALYEGLDEVFTRNVDLQQQVIEIVNNHFLKYYEQDEEIIPPVKLDCCISASGDQVYLAEPLTHLLSLLHHCVAHGSKYLSENENTDEELMLLQQGVDKFKSILSSLAERMQKCEMEDFELDKSADYSLSNSVGVKNNIYAGLVLGTMEVLMEHSFTLTECSQDGCECVLRSFKKYQSLLSIVKEKIGGTGKKSKTNSKQSLQSLLSLSTVAAILDAVFCDALPSHQHGLLVLRTEKDFVQFILSVTQQKLNQINDNGFCEGAGGHNKDNIYKQCTIIGRVLLTLVNGDSCLPETAVSNRDKLVNQGLNGFCLLMNIIMKRYCSKITSFLTAIDSHDENNTSLAGATQEDIVYRHIKRFERLVISILSPPNNAMALKDIPPIMNVISSLCDCFGENITKIKKVQSWVERICVEHNIDDIPVTKSLVNLLLSLTLQCSSSLNVEREMSADVHKQLGDIDEDIELQEASHYVIVNPRTATPTVLIALLSQFDKILEGMDWVLVKVKSDISTSLLSDDNESDVPDTPGGHPLESSLCDRMISLIYCFHELVQAAVPVGLCTETLLKCLTKFYAALGNVAKYYLFLYSQKAGHVIPKFELMVKQSGVKLSQQVYAFLTFVQTTEQEEAAGKENAKDKNTAAPGKVRIMKEMKSIPNLIFAVEQYERYLIQLTKKSKINFMDHFKRSTARDFRINGATLDAALKQDSDNDDEESLEETKTADVSGKESGQPPRKKGRR